VKLKKYKILTRVQLKPRRAWRPERAAVLQKEGLCSEANITIVKDRYAFSDRLVNGATPPDTLKGHKGKVRRTVLRAYSAQVFTMRAYLHVHIKYHASSQTTKY